ncbi:MAG: tryptophan 7-halogenase [Paracoccaceae bacterium]|nr:tryptophan 7-halogenase [Paracoccaceae bacterium]
MLGVGVAGIAAALALKQTGLDVCLIGEAVGNGPKVGEYLPASVLRPLRALGFSGLDAILGEQDVLPSTAKMSAWGSETWAYQDSLRDPEGGGWHILRHRFEQQLMHHAQSRGVEIHRAKLLELKDNGAEYRVRAVGDGGEITVQSPRLIDATGRKAWLVRRLAGAPKQTNIQMAVIAWIKDPRPTVARVTSVKSVKNGWWYTAPLPEQQRVVAFHGLADSVSQLYKSPDRFLDQARGDGLKDHLPDRAEFIAPLQSCDASVRLSPKIAGKRWLAIGDAALSFDPLSSQGLHFAFYSALKACDAICEASRSETRRLQAMEVYCRQVSDVFKSNQRTRFMFYNQEHRFRDEPYWREQCNRC